MTMNLRFDSMGRRTSGVLHLSGSLDLVHAAVVHREVEHLVSQGFTEIVVDLDGVVAIDSSGLGSLIQSLAAARRAGGDLRVARPRPYVRDLLQDSALVAVLPPYDTVEAALAARRTPIGAVRSRR
jgi:anti-sigma B factor antagonist